MTFHLSRRRGPAVARRLWRVLLVAVLPLGGACRDLAVEPPLGEEISQAEIAVFLPSLEDAIERLVPEILQPEVRTFVQGQLEMLRNQLGTGDVSRARSTIGTIIQTLDSYVRKEGLESPDMAEIVAIQFVTFHLGDLLRMQIDPSLLLHLGSPEP